MPITTNNPTTRDLIANINTARSDIFEVRNVLDQRLDDLKEEQARFGPAPSLELADRLRATEAARKAAHDTALSAATAHRNLMTVLGYEEAPSSNTFAVSTD